MPDGNSNINILQMHNISCAIAWNLKHVHLYIDYCIVTDFMRYLSCLCPCQLHRDSHKVPVSSFRSGLWRKRQLSQGPPLHNCLGPCHFVRAVVVCITHRIKVSVSLIWIERVGTVVTCVSMLVRIRVSLVRIVCMRAVVTFTSHLVPITVCLIFIWVIRTVVLKRIIRDKM